MPFDIAENIRHYGFKRLLLAVSGGLDSICLAHYFIENREALGIEWLGIAHVHHGLREGTADRDAKFVEEFAKSHDVPFFLKRLDGEALKTAEGSLEENARDARYKALVEIAQDNTKAIAIVTAHHANDQAETMYMRLKRGTTLAGLRGIQEVRILGNSRGVAGLAPEAPLEGVMEDRAAGCNQGETSPTPKDENCMGPIANVIQEIKVSLPSVEKDRLQDDKAETNCLPSTSYFLLRIFRPFLNVTRKELLAYARENGLSWCEDESNADVKFARNKIRHEILPQLEHECPGATQQLCKIARLADKAYAKMMEKCENEFASCLLNKKSLDPIASTRLQDDRREMPAHSSTPLRFAQDDTKSTPSPMVQQKVTVRAEQRRCKPVEVHQPIFRLATDPIPQSPYPTPHSSLALDKKKLNKILRTYADADLSELFRLWLSELGFRFPIGFFYGSKEPAHVKIPVRAVYRKRSIVKIRHTVWICEFGDSLTASKFVSCEMKEKDYNEPAQKANFPI